MDFLLNAQKYKHSCWRYVVTLLFSFLMTIIIPIALLAILQIVCGIIGGEELAKEVDIFYDAKSMPAYKNAISIFIWHCSLLLAFIFLFKKLHKGKIVSLVTSTTVRWRHFFLAVVMTLCWNVVTTIIELMVYDAHFVFDAKDFIPYLIVVCVMLPIQVFAEEIIVRSYLGQAISLLCRYPIVPIIVTSIVFAIPHYGDLQTAQSYYILMSSMLISGIVYAVIMVLDNGIEFCIGLHFMNNFILFAFYKTEQSYGVIDLGSDFVAEWGYLFAECVYYVILLILCTNIYHWDWSRLFKKMERPAVAEV